MNPRVPTSRWWPLYCDAVGAGEPPFPEYKKSLKFCPCFTKQGFSLFEMHFLGKEPRALRLGTDERVWVSLNTIRSIQAVGPLENAECRDPQPG